MRFRDQLGSIVATVVVVGAISAPVHADARSVVLRDLSPAGGHPGRSDYNGDGFADLAIGIPLDKVDGHAGAGSVSVIYGASGGLHAVGSDYWNQASPGIADTPEYLDQFGWALASGDVDGDGYADLAIGAPGEDLGGLTDAGVVHVLFGSSNGLTASGSRLIQSPDSSKFGTALATLDNINGVADGLADIAVGAPARSGFMIYSGAGIKNRTFNGWGKTLPPGWRAGASLAVGDFDSGGVDDLAVGFPAAGATEGGRVDIFTGTDVLTYTGNDLSVALGANDHLGMVLAAGDLDGDGLDELVMGVPFRDTGGQLDQGGVFIAPSDPDGPDATAIQVVTFATVGIAPTDQAHFGGALATGRFDAGTELDLAIGVPWRNVGGFTVAGGVVIRYNGSGGTMLTQLTTGIADTPAQGETFGSALAAANWGKGGRTDLAIGVPGEDPSGVSRAGAAHILYGSAGGLSTSTNVFYHQDYVGIGGNAGESEYFGLSLH